MAFRRRSILSVLLPLIALGPGPSPVLAQDRTGLSATLDSLARAHAAHELVAGVSAAVVHRGDTLLLGGYGYADVEWDVPTPGNADAVYEIGSVTKQFTAAAVLRLVEDGRLDLDADVTAYLPDYDTQGRRISVRRLLDHTSGIKGYTEMPMFGEFMMRDLSRDSLVARFQAEPLEFEPGRALIYNNSAYFLLGLILERVTGRGYGELVADELFAPSGMGRSYYCDEGAVIQRRAHGYDATPEGLHHKGYLDHQWPYAAGSLCSTVGDLVRWNQALHGGEVLGPDAYREMTTPRPLEDGTPVRYAMGLLAYDDPAGRRVLTHGGGINGFLSSVWLYPDQELLVVVLQNTSGPRGAGALARELADAVIGPAADPPRGRYAGNLEELEGTFSGPARGRTLTVEVTAEGDQLVITPTERGEAHRPVHHEGLTWRVGNAYWTFVREDGEVTELRQDTGGGLYVLERIGG